MLIILVSPILNDRYEVGRHTAERWNQWNENIRLISQKPYNVIGANNRYDQVRYLLRACIISDE